MFLCCPAFEILKCIWLRFRNNFGRVIEENPCGSIWKELSQPLLGRIVYPLLHPHVRALVDCISSILIQQVRVVDTHCQCTHAFVGTYWVGLQVGRGIVYGVEVVSQVFLLPHSVRSVVQVFIKITVEIIVVLLNKTFSKSVVLQSIDICVVEEVLRLVTLGFVQINWTCDLQVLGRGEAV